MSAQDFTPNWAALRPETADACKALNKVFMGGLCDGAYLPSEFYDSIPARDAMRAALRNWSAQLDLLAAAHADRIADEYIATGILPGENS